jgi:hypothetical protein
MRAINFFLIVFLIVACNDSRNSNNTNHSDSSQENHMKEKKWDTL